MKNNYPSKRQNPNIQEKAKMKTLKKLFELDTNPETCDGWANITKLPRLAKEKDISRLELIQDGTFLFNEKFE